MEDDERGQDEPRTSAGFHRGRAVGVTLKSIRTTSPFSLGMKMEHSTVLSETQQPFPGKGSGGQAGVIGSSRISGCTTIGRVSSLYT